MSWSYDLALINEVDIDNILKTKSLNNKESLPLKLKEWISDQGKYYVLQYIKDRLIGNDEKIKYCLFRSVIFNENRICAFSPPKSVDFDYFIDTFKPEECYVEEFIEGTMINLFFDNKWEISTKSTVGGNVSFFKEQQTFSTLFNEICNEKGIDFTKLDKTLCYSFVMQHVRNRIVLPITENKLYLIAVYNIDKHKVNSLNYDDRNKIAHSLGLNVPLIIYKNLFDLELLKNDFCSINTPYYIPGVSVYHNSGIRSKIKNPNYEYIKKLRGNSPKLQYQYLNLRKNNQVKEFLKFFPEKRIQFSKMRKQIHDFTYNLHKAYMDCYIYKIQAHVEFPYEYKTHMYKLHKQYLDNIGSGYIIDYNVVIDYVNNLHPAQLMYSLNYNAYKIIKAKENSETMETMETMDVN